MAARLISEQNFVAALVAGAVATFLAASAYVITVTKRPISCGFAAVGIGIVFGLLMRFPGRGVSRKFIVAASVYTITGCLLGIVFRVIFQLMSPGTPWPISVLRRYPLPDLAERSLGYFSLVDLVYRSVAVYCATFLVQRPLSRAESLAVGLYESRP